MAKIQIEPEVKTMIQEEVTEQMLSQFMEVYNASKPFQSNIWTVSTVLTLKQFTSKIKASYSNVTEAYIIAKRRNDNGKIFHKMAVCLGKTTIDEWELSYEKSRASFEEGDEIDLNTLLFCVEIHPTDEVDKEGKPIIKTHLFATGELI